MKIIAGEFKGKYLEGPAGEETTRPMPSFIKEAIFNILRGWFEDTCVVDLFAGVGTMGLEAVSRGAKKVLLVEQDSTSFEILQKNIESLNCADRAEVMQGDALSPLVLIRAPKPVSVLFVDPPYRMIESDNDRARILDHIEACVEILADKSFVVLRTPEVSKDEDMAIPGFDGPETHNYGKERKQVHFYMPSPPA